MSLRAVLTRCARFWPKKVTGLQHWKTREVIQVAVSTRKQQFTQRSIGKLVQTFSFGRLHVRCFRSLAADARNVFSRFTRYHNNLPIFAFVGFTVSIAESKGNDEVCSRIREMFAENDCSRNTEMQVFGKRVSEYSFGHLLGKGCNAAVHEAITMVTNDNNIGGDSLDDSEIVSSQSSSSFVVMETSPNNNNSVYQHSNEEYPRSLISRNLDDESLIECDISVSMATSSVPNDDHSFIILNNDCEEDGMVVTMDTMNVNEDAEDSFIIIPNNCDVDNQLVTIGTYENILDMDMSVGKMKIAEQFFEDVDRVSHQEINDSIQYNLAIKMLFNWSVESDHMKLLSAFERELVPMQQDDISGIKQMNMRKKHLPSHPNIVTIYTAFSDIDIPSITDATNYYPAALPITMNGLARNKTLFLVMKRYDMTLKEYIKDIGCPSQHVAMVIISQLLEGVCHMTRNNVAHRDLKSDNILLDYNKGMYGKQVT